MRLSTTAINIFKTHLANSLILTDYNCVCVFDCISVIAAV